MKTFKILFLIVLGFSIVSCALAQTNKRKATNKSEPKNTKPMNDKPIGGELKIIAEGSYESLETPFIFVARSAETYAQLQKFVAQLPPVSEIDFAQTAIVAAFAGTKNTGGYSVTVKKAADKIRIDVVEPPKDAMTTDALTTPFAVALVPVSEGKSLPIEVSANWKNAMQNFRITSGEFERSSVSAKRMPKFGAEGKIGVLIFGDYATFVFNLKGKGAGVNFQLTETASGVVKDGSIQLARFGAGNFADDSPLKASGTLSADKISLFFESLSSGVKDKFQTSGKIQAVKVK